MWHAAVTRLGIAVIVACAESSCGGDPAPAKDDGLALPPRTFPPEDASAAPADAGLPEAGGPGDAGDAVDGGNGGDSGGAGCNGALDCERVVFVTKGTFVGGAVGGLPGADAKCQAAAATSTIPRIKDRTFRAWLATPTMSTAARLPHGTSPYILANGTIVANNWNDLTDGSLDNGINRDETNSATAGSAWTGTNTNGTASAATCGVWDTSQANGQRGNVGGAGNGWTDATNALCTASFHLYCFEQ